MLEPFQEYNRTRILRTRIKSPQATMASTKPSESTPDLEKFARVSSWKVVPMTKFKAPLEFTPPQNEDLADVYISDGGNTKEHTRAASGEFKKVPAPLPKYRTKMDI